MRPAYTKPFLIVILIVLLDQIIKTWVRTHMYLGQDIEFLGDHGMLHYTEKQRYGIWHGTGRQLW